MVFRMERNAFSLAASCRQRKEFFLGDLCVSVVKLVLIEVKLGGI